MLRIFAAPLTNKIGLLGVIPAAAFGLTGYFFAASAGPGYTSQFSLPLVWFSRAVAAQYLPADKSIAAFVLYQTGAVATVMVFSLAFWVRTNPARRCTGAQDNLLLAVQLACVLFGRLDLSYFIAMEVALLLPRWSALNWLAAIVISCLLVLLPFVGWFGAPRYIQPSKLLAEMPVMAVLQAVAFGVGLIIAAEQQARTKLAAANAELLATQQLLADAVRTTERLRIARDLHDAIGHHLTALNLHLELASLQPEKAGQVVSVARGVTQDMLAEVRRVVSNERQTLPIDIRQALTTLCRGILTPRIALTIETPLSINSPTIAHALFYAVREGITNVVRHARAKQLTIEVGRTGQSIVATLSDDGIGMQRAPQRNGMIGMRERIEANGGTVFVSDMPGGGFRLRIEIPSDQTP